MKEHPTSTPEPSPKHLQESLIRNTNPTVSNATFIEPFGSHNDNAAENNLNTLDQSINSSFALNEKKSYSTTIIILYLLIDPAICIWFFCCIFLSFSYINVFNQIWIFLLWSFYLDIKAVNKMWTLKKKITSFIFALNFLYVLCGGIWFCFYKSKVAEFAPIAYLQKIFNIESEKTSFTVFNFVVACIELSLIAVYYFLNNWNESFVNKVLYKQQYNLLSFVKVNKSHFLTIAIYLISFSACCSVTTTHLMFLLVVLVHFLILAINKHFYGKINKYICCFFINLIPSYSVVNYTIHCKEIYWYVNNETMKNKLAMYGISKLYDWDSFLDEAISKKYLAYDYKMLNILPFAFLFIAVTVLNVYVKSKEITNDVEWEDLTDNNRGKNTTCSNENNNQHWADVDKKSIKKQGNSFYKKDFDFIIVSYIYETENMKSFEKLKHLIMKYWYSPNFLLHWCRIGVMIWINMHFTYFSHFLILWLLLSMVWQESVLFVFITKWVTFTVLIVSFIMTYFVNIKGIDYVFNNFGFVKFATDDLLLWHMWIRITIITLFRVYIRLHSKHTKASEQKPDRISLSASDNIQRILKDEIKKLSISNYAMTPIEIIFKFVFIFTEIALILSLYFSVAQSINLLNEIFLLILISILILSNILTSSQRYYLIFLILLNVSFQLKLLVYFLYPQSTYINKNQYSSNIYNTFSLWFYDEHKNIHYYWISSYLLFISYNNWGSELFKISKNKKFSFYEFINNNKTISNNCKSIMTLIFDFWFGIYIWLLIPWFVLCLLSVDNNILFWIQLFMIFIIYYKYIKITGTNYQNYEKENIFKYILLLIWNSVAFFIFVYWAQFLNKPPFSLWYALTSNRFKKILELMGLFIFSGSYSTNFIPYFGMFLLSLALYMEISRQVKINTELSKESMHKKGKYDLNYSQKIYMLLYYVLHYYWILIFIVTSILAMHWMVSVSMAIQLILFSYYIMKSFRGYYRCLKKQQFDFFVFNTSSNNDKIPRASIDITSDAKLNVQKVFNVYTIEKEEHFRITSDYQHDYFNLVWKFTFTFITLSYWSCILIKNIDDDETVKVISAICYFLGVWSEVNEENKLNFLYYSWGYFLIIGWFSFRSYFVSKFTELKKKEDQVLILEMKKRRKMIKKKEKESQEQPIVNNEDYDSNPDSDEDEDDEEEEDANGNTKIDSWIRKTKTIFPLKNRSMEKKRNSFNMNSKSRDSFNSWYFIQTKGHTELNFPNWFNFSSPTRKRLDSLQNCNSSTSLKYSNTNLQESNDNLSQMNNYHASSMHTPEINPDNQGLYRQELRSKDDSSIRYRASFIKRKQEYISYSLNAQIIIKKLIEIILISLILISAFIKVNIISFILILYIIFTYKNRTLNWTIMFHISFVVLTLFIIQYILFVSNVSNDINPFILSEGWKYWNEKLYIPWYKHILGYKWGWFFSCGVIKYQLHSLWIDVVIWIIIYFYLEFFSFTIYESNVNENEINEIEKKEFEKMHQKFIKIKTLTTPEYHSFARAMKISFNINLIPKRTEAQIERNENYIINSIEHDVEHDGEGWEQDKNSKIFDEKLTWHNTQNYKIWCYKYFLYYLYLSFHYIALILILWIGSLNTGWVSFGYMCFSIFYIYKTHCFLKGRCWTFQNGIIYFLKPYWFFDLLVEFLFQIPFDVFLHGSLSFKTYLLNLGYQSWVDYNSKTYFVKMDILGIVLLKVWIYFLISIQEMIYTSKDFRIFILNYHLNYIQKGFIKGKLNAFWFNNTRVKMMNESLSDRDAINTTLKKWEGMIMKWNTKWTNQETQGKMSMSKGNELRESFDRGKAKENEEKSEKLNLKKENEKENDYDKYMKKYHKKLEKISIIKLLKKHWLINLAMDICEQSPTVYNDKIGNENEIFKVLKGSTVMNSELDLWLQRFVEENKEKYDVVSRYMKSLSWTGGFDGNDSLNSDSPKKSLDRNDIENEGGLEEENKISNVSRNNDDELKGNKDAVVSKNPEINPFKDGNNNNQITNNPTIKTNKSKHRLISKRSIRTFDIDSFLTSSDYYDLKDSIRNTFFSKYCSKIKIVMFMFKSFSNFILENFEFVCYFFMLLNNFMNGSLISMVWAFMVFAVGIVQNPRPDKFFWKLCLMYNCFVIFIKFLFQLHIWDGIELFTDLSNNVSLIRIGIIKCSTSEIISSFFTYIIYDFLWLSVFWFNQFNLIRRGLWNITEVEYETIEEANERIKWFNSVNYKDKGSSNPTQAQLKKELSPDEINELFGKSKFNRLSLKKQMINFYKKIFSSVRNEKPGKDYYLYYTIIQMFLLIYIIFFYTKMDRDKLVSSTSSFSVKQFSGNMVIFAFVHLFLIIFDRFIYLKNSRKLKKIAFKVYNINTGEDVTDAFGIADYFKAKEKCEENNDIYDIVSYQYEGIQVGLICKFTIQILTVIYIHVFAFFYLPIKGQKNMLSATSTNEFLSNFFIIMFYLLYCIYFLFSGWQIKYGLADMRKKSSLMKGSNIIYSVVFKCYKAIPFLYELKQFIDWTFTTTSLDLFKWWKFEEINDLWYINRCFAKSYMGRRVGSKIEIVMKVFMGGFFVLIIVVIVFGPLILFSTLNPSNSANGVVGAKLSIVLNMENVNPESEYGNYNFTLWKSKNSKIKSIDDYTYLNVYSKSTDTKIYDRDQIQDVVWTGYGENDWDISGKGFDFLISKIYPTSSNPNNNDYDFYWIIKYLFYREHDTTATNWYGFNRCQWGKGERDSVKDLFIFKSDDNKKLSNIKTNQITLKNCFTPNVKVPSDSVPDYWIDNTTNVILSINNLENNTDIYWEISTEGKSGLEFITFSELYSSSTMGYDVLTFYVTFILVVGNTIRSIFFGQAERVIYTEMVNPNKLLNVCEGIKISRIRKDFLQEDKLYYLLIDLMRSPEIMKSITKSSLLYVQTGNIVRKNLKSKKVIESIAITEKFSETKRKAFENEEKK